jgi:UDP-galactopyranose mutase
MELNGLKYLVVGSGFFGSVIAERIANDLGERVVVLDQRDHIGGNSFSEPEQTTGIDCHIYGSHIFHTKSNLVWAYINRFCSFNSYRHKVLTNHKGCIYQMPVNLDTINRFFGTSFTPAEARAFVEEEMRRECLADPQNLEEKAISLVGRRLYEAFIKGYTAKQWQTDPKLLPADIISRLPFRFSYKIDYFDDPWQGIPLEGYGAVFKRILDAPKIEVLLNTDYFAIRDQIPADCMVIYTGPIDRFFEYRFGILGWRSLRFEKEVLPCGDSQGTTVMNYADEDVPFTRIHEFRHYHDERQYPADQTVVYREYSLAGTRDTDPYYPVNTAQDRSRYQEYCQAAEQESNVLFGGRLGTYSYLDMDRVILQALEMYETKIKRGSTI